MSFAISHLSEIWAPYNEQLQALADSMSANIPELHDDIVEYMTFSELLELYGDSIYEDQ